MLTKVLSKVLVCSPTHFDVSYAINPWMKPGTVDKDRARMQWQQLVSMYQTLGVTVTVIDQQEGLPDMVFAADQGIIVGNTVIASNFRYQERQGEQEAYRWWFQKQQYRIETLPKDATIEGHGECLFFQDMLFVGIGFRANKQACGYLREFLKMSVIALELVNPAFYHLDTCLFILNETTAFYYPKAFSLSSQKLLKKYISHLLPFSDEEASSFAANSAVTNHHVVLPSGIPTFRKKLVTLGYTPVVVDISEFIKAGGGMHCLTGILEETYRNFDQKVVEKRYWNKTAARSRFFEL